MIDLRSDTVTKPDKEMLETILYAQLGDSGRIGDNGRGEDPAVNMLEDYAAKLLHKEAAAFVCSGTMGNSVSVLTKCRPKDKILVDCKQHLYKSENFCTNDRFGQLVPIVYKSDDRGIPDTESVEELMKKENIKFLQIENTLNSYGGTCIPLSVHKKLRECADKNGAWIHLDGARLFNAAAGLKCEPWEIAQYVDSVMFCVSKGIGAPFGSVVCGSKEFIDEVRITQKFLGGGMRQAGIMAAPALYALQHNLRKMEEDNRHAALTADSLRNLKHVRPQQQVDSNILMLYTLDMRPEKYAELLKSYGVLAGPVGDDKVRLVYHLNISDEDTLKAIDIIRKLDAELG